MRSTNLKKKLRSFQRKILGINIEKSMLIMFSMMRNLLGQSMMILLMQQLSLKKNSIQISSFNFWRDSINYSIFSNSLIKISLDLIE